MEYLVACVVFHFWAFLFSFLWLLQNAKKRNCLLVFGISFFIIGPFEWQARKGMWRKLFFLHLLCIWFAGKCFHKLFTTFSQENFSYKMHHAKTTGFRWKVTRNLCNYGWVYVLNKIIFISFAILTTPLVACGFILWVCLLLKRVRDKIHVQLSTDLVELTLNWIRCWINNWCWSLYSCWNSCKRANGTRSCFCIPNSWNSSRAFSILLCRACLSLSICWECLSLFVRLCWRRVSSSFFDNLVLNNTPSISN